jgi:hypothetical protein
MACLVLAAMFAAIVLWALDQQAVVLAVALTITGLLAGAGIWGSLPALIYAGAAVLLVPTLVHAGRLLRAGRL